MTDPGRRARDDGEAPRASGPPGFQEAPPVAEAPGGAPSSPVVTSSDARASQPSPGPGPGHPRHPGAPQPGQAGIGSIFVLAFIVILVPGIVVYLVSHALGLGLGPASLLGLLTVIVCLGCYPSVLVRLGWVRRRSRRR